MSGLSAIDSGCFGLSQWYWEIVCNVADRQVSKSAMSARCGTFCMCLILCFVKAQYCGLNSYAYKDNFGSSSSIKDFLHF